GGLILTASHNPAGWNALKFLNEKGEFLSPDEIEEIRVFMGILSFPATDKPGKYESTEGTLTYHIQKILSHPWIDTEAVQRAKFRVVIDGINSSGSVFVPALLEGMGVEDIILINGEPDGKFSHAPEPLPENLTELSQMVRKKGAHLGIAVDPDVDRVAFFLPNGAPFGEEYTLVAVSDYILSQQRGPVVTNLSTTSAVQWVTQKYGVPFYESKVGEYFVVKKMKEVEAVIGGEGNGGVIWPALHYGRDALVAIALFLSHLAKQGGDAIALREQYPFYTLIKSRLLLESTPPSTLWQRLIDKAGEAEVSLLDGLKLRWQESWIHIRLSGTEPVLRLIAEAPTEEEAKFLIKHWTELVRTYIA
ncbi:MAG: phosphoglucosamine mutase, partial [Bacteroidia bacterium]|nr:phosphoglucosamine mutase [Bacteroidia bacterium]MDW8135107.1 phosphoglucosamine mutase [Bacteroidia bacterium]